MLKFDMSNRRVLINFFLLFLGTVAGCGLAVTPPVEVVIKPADDAATEVAASEQPAAPSESPSQGTPSESGGVSNLVGKIIYDGEVPKLPPVVTMGQDVKDASVCAAATIPDESLEVDPESKGIRNVFVYLEKAPAGAAPVAAPEKQIFDQKGCRFLPHSLIVRTKVPLLVLSDDAVGHNTHTFPQRNSGFNGAIGANDRKGVAILYTQSEREPFKVTCDVHPWMSAYHLPLDHGFAAVTDEKGEFVIKGLPAGEHTIKIWHEAGKLLERGLKVNLKAGGGEPIVKKYLPAKFGK